MDKKPIISKEELERKLKEIYYGEPNVDPAILDNKILSGYLYTLSWSDLSIPYDNREKLKVNNGKVTGHREIMLSTGKAGVETYIKSCREQGIPEGKIGDSIWLQIEDGNNGKWVTINQLTVNAKEKSDTDEEDPSQKNIQTPNQ